MAPIANTSASPMFKAFRAGVVLIAAILCASATNGSENEGEAVVLRRAAPIVTFNGRFDGGYLIVEASLAPGWHIYAMDNVERAKRKTGKDAAECELPTRFAVEGPIELTGDWRQSEPADLSNPDIFWYTWGFVERAVFAVPAKITGDGPITVTINGQSCNAESCSMIQDLELRLPKPHDAQPGFRDADYAALAPLLTRASG